MTDKKYHNLVAALAQFAKHNDAIGLDEFMTAYAGADWAAAAGRPLPEEAPDWDAELRKELADATAKRPLPKE